MRRAVIERAMERVAALRELVRLGSPLDSTEQALLDLLEEVDLGEHLPSSTELQGRLEVLEQRLLQAHEALPLLDTECRALRTRIQEVELALSAARLRRAAWRFVWGAVVALLLLGPQCIVSDEPRPLMPGAAAPALQAQPHADAGGWENIINALEEPHAAP